MSKIKDNVREVIEASGDYRYDLIFTGGSAHAWITELSSVVEDGSFEAFVSRILANDFTFEDMTAVYTTRGKTFDVKYSEYFKINGETVDTNYARYESNYVGGKVERGAEIIEISFGGYLYILNYEDGTRMEFEWK